MARHFTVQEAADHIRIVEPVLKDAVRLKREHDELLRRHQPVGSDEVQRLRKDIVARMEFIRALGIQIKDLDHGLIDFPTMRDGEEVLLCWRLGEPQVAYWHTYEDGFPGRRRL
jgi:hypothetical protein